MSRTVSERTCRGNTRSKGKEKRGKESKSTPAKHTHPQQPNINATSRKGNTHSLAINAIRRAQPAHNYNTGSKEKTKLDYVATTRP